MVEQSCSFHGSQERVRGRNHPYKLAPSDSLPPARSHFLIFLSVGICHWLKDTEKGWAPVI